MEKKLKLTKKSFVDYFIGDQFVWIDSDTNFLKELDQYPELKDIDNFRYRNLKKDYVDNDIDFNMPEGILDGLEFGDYVKKHFKNKYKELRIVDFDEILKPNGVMDWDVWKKLPTLTEELMNDDNFVMFEGLFEYKGFRMKPDVLIKKNGRLYLIEAKAVTAPKTEHSYDISYQYFLLKKLGYSISRKDLRLATLNHHFILEDWMTDDDVSNQIVSIYDREFGNSPNKAKIDDKTGKYTKLSERISSIEDRGESFDKILENIIEIQKKDDISVSPLQLESNIFDWRYFGEKDYEKWLLLKAGTNLKGSIFNYTSRALRMKNKNYLWNHGVREMSEVELIDLIPKSKLDNYQSEAIDEVVMFEDKLIGPIQQMMFNKKKDVFFNTRYIKNFLEDFKGPIYMFDFETYKTAIPRQVETKPYEQIPYQFSLHVILNKDDFDWSTSKNIVHYEWLADSKIDLVKNFWRNFIDAMKSHGSGTPVSFNKSFENNIMKYAIQEGQLESDDSIFLQEIIDTCVDLMLPFATYQYNAIEFNGSYSIKKVAPHFSKGKLDYKTLNNIQKGDQSSVECKRWIMRDEDKFRKRWEFLRTDMLKYCEYDTKSMVIIYQELINLVNEKN